MKFGDNYNFNLAYFLFTNYKLNSVQLNLFSNNKLKFKIIFEFFNF